MRSRGLSRVVVGFGRPRAPLSRSSVLRTLIRAKGLGAAGSLRPAPARCTGIASTQTCRRQVSRMENRSLSLLCRD